MNTEQLKYFMEFAFYGTAEKTAAQLGAVVPVSAVT